MASVWRLDGEGHFLAVGEVSSVKNLKFVGASEVPLFEFSVYCGKKENGEKSYVNCKAWRDLAGTLCELQKGDCVLCVGKLETREYNGKTYNDLNLLFGSSPMISAGAAVADVPAVSPGTSGEAKETHTPQLSGKWSELAEADAAGMGFLSDVGESDSGFEPCF